MSDHSSDLRVDPRWQGVIGVNPRYLHWLGRPMTTRRSHQLTDDLECWAPVTHTDLLIVDDITAALDATTEQQILDRVITRRDKRSLIIVSNSSEVIARADKLIKLVKLIEST